MSTENKTLPPLELSVEGMADPISFLLGASPHEMSTEQLRQMVEKNRELVGSPQALRKELIGTRSAEGSLERVIGEVEL